MKELNLSKEIIDYYLNFRVDLFDAVYTTDLILRNKEGGYKNIYDDNNELILSIKIDGNYFNLHRYEKINGFRTKKSITEVNYIAFNNNADIITKRYDENDNIIEMNGAEKEYYAEYKNNELLYEKQKSSLMLFTTIADEINRPNGLFIKLFTIDEKRPETESPYSGKISRGTDSIYINFHANDDDLDLIFRDIYLDTYNYNKNLMYSIIVFTVKDLSYDSVRYCYLKKFNYTELLNYTESIQFYNTIKELYAQNKE